MIAEVRKAKPIVTLAVRSGEGSEFDEHESGQHPLDLGLIRRLFRYTRPHARQRNWLMLSVLLRAGQLPIATWMIGRIIQGPIAHGNVRGATVGITVFAVLTLWTAINFHVRIRWSLNLGEAVIHDLRADVFDHLQSMTMDFITGPSSAGSSAA